ncbi:MAG: nuclear transport factor 2 family protein [Gemmatimonadota bacterium]|nr:nuclear transport factor 2 family protein [Gemmatimonadota bacterium]
MRRIALFLALLSFTQGELLFAQEWSDEEQGVLDNLAECWDIWMEGTKTGSPERWISECSTPKSTYWPSANGAPLTNEFTRRTWGAISGRDLGWVDIRPVSLTVVDDIAVLHFYGYWRAATADGETITEAKRTEVFRRINGRWKLISGHGTPVTPADAEPYR